MDGVTMAIDIKDIQELFAADLERESENRDAAQDDISFAKMGNQWPEQAKIDREREGRPCLTLNRMPTFIRQVVNDSRINSPQIKVKPVDDDADTETADIMGGLIRNIEYSSQADVAYDTAFDSSATCGMGFWRIVTEYCDEQSFAQEIKIKRITNPLSVVFDAYSESIDGSDWNHAAVTEYLTDDELKRRYQVTKSEKMQSFAGESDDGMDGDEEKTIRIAEFWHATDEPETLLMLSDGSVLTKAEFEKPHPDIGIPLKDILADLGITVSRERKSSKRVIKQYICGSEIIETNDWAGKYIPVIPVFGDEVFYEGKRYLKSLIRDGKDAQRNFNYWRSAATEAVALGPKTPFIGPEGAFDTDADKWNTANLKNHPYIQYDGPVPPQRQPFVGVPAGMLQEAMNASDDMKTIIGLQDASLGAKSNETSGKAIMARQREGDVSTFHFIDNLAKSIAHTGRILVDLIPKIYDTERVIRIIGIDGETENVQLKKPTQHKGVERIFDLQLGKYDVAVDTGPSFTTQREETAQQMTELIRSFPQAAPFIGDLLVKNLNWPDSDEIGKRLKAMLPPQIQQMEGVEGLPPEAMMRIKQLEGQLKQQGQQMQQGMGEFQKVIKELEAVKADKALESRKLEIDAYDKETNRIKVQAEIGEAIANQFAQRQPLYADQQNTPMPAGM